MRREELVALGRIAGDSAADLTSRVHETHRAIASRVFAAAGPGSRPVAAIHDGIAAGMYGTVAAASRGVLRAAGELAAVAAAPDAPALGSAPAGRRALAVLNGVAGDRLHAGGSALALTTELIESPESPAARIAVLVHGLGQSEATWRRGEGDPPLGVALRERLGIAPIYVRYNSGRPVQDVGRELAALLERRAEPTAEIVLVGHALGGLVAEAAVLEGGEWTERVAALVALGAPYRGLTVGAALRGVSRALGRLPETRAVAGLLEARSAGIKQSEIGGARLLPGRVRRLFVSGTLGADPGRWPARVLGDLIVSRDSAWAHGGGAVALAPESYRQIGGASHFALPVHPAVVELVVRWLGEPRLLAAGRG